MHKAIAEGGFTRRQVLQGGALTLAALAAGGWLAARLTDGRPGALVASAKLGAAEQAMLARVSDALLDGMLPTDAAARADWLQRVVRNADAYLQTLPLSVQAETAKLFSMLAFAPTRLLLVGQWQGWSQVSRDEITARLEALRSSDSALKNTIYRVLRDLAMSGFYADRGSWALIGYPGPIIDRAANG